MTTYDDKTKGIVASGGRFILPQYKEYNEVTFKASYIVVPDLVCTGKITALFDLTILGNVEAAEIDVKGKFVCLGNCTVGGSIVVQNEIWANDIRASKIESHDRIVAQEIDGDTILADGSIVVGKILAVERLAKTEKNILCGETAYGAGKVAANTIITGEPLDLDDGEDAVESPNFYKPKPTANTAVVNSAASPVEPTDLIAIGESSYAPNGDFFGYLNVLTNAMLDVDVKAKFKRWHDVLSEATMVKRTSSLGGYTNIALLIWMAEIAWSDYFKEWDAVDDLFDTFESHFKGLIGQDKSAVVCSIDCYDSWLEALSVLSRFGALIDRDVYNTAFELLVSNLGIKAKFVSERLNEKGWEAHGE